MQSRLESIKKFASRSLSLLLVLVLLFGLAMPGGAAEAGDTAPSASEGPVASEEPTSDGASASGGGTSDSSEVPDCDCGTEGDIGVHADACALKTWYSDLYANTSAEDLAALWSELPAGGQAYILDSVSWDDQTKREELLALLETEEEPSGTETVVGNATFISETEITVTEISEEKQAALTEAPFLQELGEEGSYAVYDIDGSEATAITISGLLDSGDHDVTIYHLLDTASAITEDMDCFVVSEENAAQFADEIAAAREAIEGLTENRVYYTVQQVMPDENGSITFDVDSFSTFIVKAIWTSPTSPTPKAVLNIRYMIQDINDPTKIEEFVPVSDVLTQEILVTTTSQAWPPTAFDIDDFAEEVKDFGTLVEAYVLLNGVQQKVEAVSYYYAQNSSSGEWIGGWYYYADENYATAGSASGKFASGTEADLFLVFSDSYKETASSKESGIIFNLFDYGNGHRTSGLPVDNYDINKDDNGNLRAIAPFFDFAATSSAGSMGDAVDNLNNPYDAGGFNEYHATVDRNLMNGFPAYSLTRSHTDDNARSGVDENGDPLLTDQERSLAYLFDKKTTSKAVQYYEVKNTLLTYDPDTGMYSYDSWANAVDYDTSTQQFLVRNYRERSSSTAWVNDKGYTESTSDDFDAWDFFPLNSTGGYSGNEKTIGSVYDDDDFMKGWEADVITAGNTVAKPMYDSSYTYQYGVNQFNYGFGMTMELKFTQSPGGINSKTEGPQIFEFSGDDDVWVFIDDILVLDLGGAHPRVSGTINFFDGRVEEEIDASVYYMLTGAGTQFGTTIYDQYKKAYQARGMTEEQVNSKLAEVFEEVQVDEGTVYRFRDYSSHTLKFFYLERGSYASNCSIYFNLETIPTNDLEITKSVEGGTAVPDEEYDFSVTLTDSNSDNTPITYASATIYDAADNIVGTVTDSSGDNVEDGVYKFRMKAGETIVFHQLAALTAYILLEDASEKYAVSWSNDSGGSGTGTSFKGVMGAEEVIFQCVNTLLVADLTISKVYSGGVPVPDLDPEQTFIFHVNGVDGTSTGGFSMDVMVRGNDSVTIKDLFVGDYVITEDSGWSWRYTVAEDGVTAVQLADPAKPVTVNQQSGIDGYGVTLDGSGVNMTFTNDRPEDRWMDGNGYAQNLFVTKKEDENEQDT